MLRREVRHSFLSPRLIPFKYQTDGTNGNDPTVSIGSGDLYLEDAGSEGSVDFFLPSRPYKRNALVFASIGDDVGAGGYIHESTAFTKGTGTLDAVDKDGLAVDGTVQGFLLGYDSEDTHAHGKKCSRLVCARRHTRLMGFQVNTQGSGSIAINDGRATISRAGTGDVTVTLSSLQSFGSAELIVVPTVVGDIDASVVVSSVQADSFGLKCYDNAGDPKDCVVNVIVIGFEAGHEHGGARALVRNTQLKPRVVAGRIAVAGGVPSAEVGGDDFTITDDGVGDYDIVLANPFSRAPIVIALAEGGRATVTSDTGGHFNIKVSDEDGVAMDSDVQFFALGSDSEVVY